MFGNKPTKNSQSVAALEKAVIILYK